MIIEQSQELTALPADTNSGESAVQGGDRIVNEQEQNQPTNQEEFIDDTHRNNEFSNSPQTGLPTIEVEKTTKDGGTTKDKARGDDTLIPEVGNDSDETGEKAKTIEE